MKLLLLSCYCEFYREKLKNKVIQREEFNVKESQRFNISVQMNHQACLLWCCSLEHLSLCHGDIPLYEIISQFCRTSYTVIKKTYMLFYLFILKFHIFGICIYLPPLLWSVWDTKLILSGVVLVWIESFPSRLVAVPGLKSPVYFTIYL